MNNRPNKDGTKTNVEWLWKKRERTSLESSIIEIYAIAAYQNKWNIPDTSVAWK
ncbi:hypothetical protein [Dysgonomonas mossii]|uniref:hypothetical protein n=1 Tax=Dysgonomonas mossii TaxID=163665 RepID=UPI003993DDA5